MCIRDRCKDVLPGAAAVVNPHRSDCAYPFKNLAGVGGALKLVMALAGRERYEAVFARYCTLAAIGTVADVMSMTGENQMCIRDRSKVLTREEAAQMAFNTMKADLVRYANKGLSLIHI